VRFWKTLIPDEPLISDGEVIQARYLMRMPPAVKGWCFVSIVANGVVVALATGIFRNAAPLLLGAIFTLFPLVHSILLERPRFYCRYFETARSRTVSVCVSDKFWRAMDRYIDLCGGSGDAFYRFRSRVVHTYEAVS
jgi:hypothetical protein